jgi:mitochondrial fission protein ELM1
MSKAEKLPGSPSVWVLSSPGAGDNAQLATVAGLLTQEPVWQSGFDPLHRVVLDRIGGLPKAGSESALRSPDGTRFKSPWPDLVLIAGGRHVINACRIRAASGGRTRVVCLGRPWAPLAWFDLVVTTPQYRLPQDDNVVLLDLPLNSPPAESEAARAHWQPRLASLPGPRLGVLLGGNSGSFRLTRGCERRMASRIQQIAAAHAAGVVLVDSPRSPEGLADRIGKRLSVPVCVCCSREGAPNPYVTVIHSSDALLVTEDSVSMVADVVHAGKPVAVLELAERMHARASRRLRQSVRWLPRVGVRLTRHGFWCPPRDLRTLREHLISRGLVSRPDDVLSAPRRLESPLHAAQSRVVSRLSGLLARR